MIFNSRTFRREPLQKRRCIIHDASTAKDFASTGGDPELLNLSEAMIEQAIGYIGVPLGLAGPLLIDGYQYMVPMATEEPSVIAATTYAGAIVGHHEGIKTQAEDPVMIAQIFIEKSSSMGMHSVGLVLSQESLIRKTLAKLLESMEKRGGGWRGMHVHWLTSSQILAIHLKIDVRNAMGANLLNSVAEKIRPLLEKIVGGRALMATVSNRSWDRIAQAQLSIPLKNLRHPGFDGKETARRIVRAAQIAQEDPDRAVTHNKGIMNGISALALATANDTRGIEAAVHSYATRNGTYQGLSQYWIENGMLHGFLKIPLPFAVVGGAVGMHPTSRWSLEILNNPTATTLSRIAAAVGLSQNLAALRALVCEGIPKGHMKLHARRLAFDVGARNNAMSEFATMLWSEGIRSRSHAAKRYEIWKNADETP